MSWTCKRCGDKRSIPDIGGRQKPELCRSCKIELYDKEYGK